MAVQVGTGYTGHGRSGGVQEHSKGDMYPYTVIAKGRIDALDWHAMDLRTSKLGPPRRTYKEAQIDVHGIQIRNMMHH